MSNFMTLLTALLGSWGRKGGIFLPTAIPRGGFALPDFPESTRGRADGAGTRFPLGSEELGITNGLVRLSVGIEDVDDLLADLARGLEG